MAIGARVCMCVRISVRPSLFRICTIHLMGILSRDHPGYRRLALLKTSNSTSVWKRTPVSSMYVLMLCLDFTDDLLDELNKFGRVEELHVCQNLGDHMFGNVYVKFRGNAGCTGSGKTFPLTRLHR